MAVAKSTETPVFTGFPAHTGKVEKQVNNEKISCSITASQAVSLLGKTVLVELSWDDDPESLWCFVHVVGVVLALEGLYEHPCFMVLSVAKPQAHPEEMFWSNIRTLQVLEQRRH